MMLIKAMIIKLIMMVMRMIIIIIMIIIIVIIIITYNNNNHNESIVVRFLSSSLNLPYDEADPEPNIGGQQDEPEGEKEQQGRPGRFHRSRLGPRHRRG